MKLRGRIATTVGVGVALAATAPASDLIPNPWADGIVSYSAGTDPDPGYTDPAVALGSPERMTGEGTAWPGAVTPFNGAWTTDEVVSIGKGGHLTVSFDEPITNDPSHLFGVDFLIFGNGVFGDGNWPNAVVGGLIEEGPFTVSVSDDGATFVELASNQFDAFFPALGYLDLAGAYDTTPGAIPSDFTKPVDPSLTFADFDGKNFSEIVALYDGSGGGIPFDIDATGLSEVSFVRIDVPADAMSGPDFDAFVAVPEPNSAALLLAAVAVSALRRGR